jgi:hypothetical protein
MESWDLVNLPGTLPCLPVQKLGTNDYCPVQDLWADDQTAVTLHLVVPNPYTLLALIPAKATGFSCFDSKDTFFCVQLAPVSQPIFAFQWEDSPVRGATIVNLHPSPTGFQELPNCLWNCSGIRFTSIPSRESQLHTLTICGLQRSSQTDPEEGTFSLALFTNQKLTSLWMAEAWGVNWQTVDCCFSWAMFYGDVWVLPSLAYLSFGIVTLSWSVAIIVTAPAGQSLNQEALSDTLSLLLTGCGIIFGCFYPGFPFQMVMPHANFPK